MSRRITVVQLVDGRSPGGAEMIALQIASGLDPVRWRPVLVAPADLDLAPLTYRAAAGGVPVVRVPRPSSAWEIADIPRLARALRRLRPAIVHVHRGWARAGNLGVIAARLAGVPIVVTTEHLWLPTTPRRAGLIRRVVDRMVDQQLAVSADIAAHLHHDLGAPADRVRVIENGIDPEPLRGPRDQALRHALLGAEEGTLVVTPARLERQKGQETLIRAAALLPGVSFALAGDGPDHPRLQQLAHDLRVDERVRFLGMRSDVAALIKAADLVVLPSVAEGLPLVLLEALASETPVVGSDIPGIREVLADGRAGRLVPTGDVMALAAAIDALLRDPDERARLAGVGRAIVEHRFTARRMVDEVAATYDERLSAHPSKHEASSRSTEPGGMAGRMPRGCPTPARGLALPGPGRPTPRAGRTRRR